MLTRFFFIAVLAGFAAGAAASLIQTVWTVPLIMEAELYEFGILEGDGKVVEGKEVDYLAAIRGDLSEESFAHRHAKTFLVNVLNGTGLALILVAVLAFRPSVAGWREGMLWGLAGFVAMHLAPALGLPPKLPGTQTAPLEDRQFWWILTMALTAGGLALLAFTKHWAPRLGGLALLALPHVIGAPRPEGNISSSPLSLQHEFIAASLTTGAAQWLALGACVGFIWTRQGMISPGLGRSTPAAGGS